MRPPHPIPRIFIGLLLLILSAMAASAVTVPASFSNAADVPVTNATYTATGNSVKFTLSFAPPVGTNLTVVNNTGLASIQGTFDNLAQGQKVNLIFNGIFYPYVANYFGGTGNDLVLHWGNTRLLAWGTNNSGQLGNGNSRQALIPVAVDMTGVLAGKTVIATARGASHCLALCADGSLAAWGNNANGQLGNNTTTNSSVAVAVDTSGVLAGKSIIAVGAGDGYSLVLCADGTLAAWGGYCLGRSGATTTGLPAKVDQTGALAGKTVTAISAGLDHVVVACADGTAAAWGNNNYGQLGNNSTTSSPVPVLVNQSGVLAGKKIVAVAAATNFSLARCADGTLASWGTNFDSQLGNPIYDRSQIPVLVNKTGALTGKTLAAISSRWRHSLALCSDGTLAAWGDNNYGQLGNNNRQYDSKIPVAVDRTGVLTGKTVTAIAGGGNQAMCSDGTLVAWGENYSGQLGNNSTWDTSIPVLVDTTALRTGERFIPESTGNGFSSALVLVASPPLPTAATVAATAVIDTGATLMGTVTANGSSTAVTFEYGLTSTYGTTVATTPATVTGTTATATSATLSGLLSGTTYHYRVVAASAGGTVRGADMTFTTSTLARLASLGVSSASLNPAFSGINTSYEVIVPSATASILFTPVTQSGTATVKVNGVAVTSGTTSGPITLGVGHTPITIEVAAGDGNTQTYSVTVVRPPAVFAFNSATDVQMTVRDFVATGNTAALALNFAPLPGTNLTVVRNTGSNLIQGTFDNLTQGQVVELTFGGIPYSFVANYYGGSGNDLVLQWANTRVLAWGSNNYGQLGNGTTVASAVPVAVDTAGVLAGKSITAIASQNSHTLALCADGTLAAWGYNNSGQLGNNTQGASASPVAVNRTGVLAGKMVVAIATGEAHSLVLCNDGTLAAWGTDSGVLGSGGSSNRPYSNLPVLVDRTGVLAGKTVTAIAAGGAHNLVLCADGTLAAWGVNTYGQLGNNSTTPGNVPVLVDRSGVLAGKTVIAIATGSNHSLALCADGTLAAWGMNEDGQLGEGSAYSSPLPVLVDRSGVLAGKTVTAIAAGRIHSLALCADGTLAAWGNNDNGQLGNAGPPYSDQTRPVLVDRTGVLTGKTVTAISAANYQNIVRCEDATLAEWGWNGTGSWTYGSVPELTNTTSLRAGERSVSGVCGASYKLALVASPTLPAATTLAASALADTGVTLNGSVNACGSSTAVSFEYGLTTGYGTTVAAVPASATGTTLTASTAVLSGLLSGATYHYRIVATSAGGTVKGADMTFTTSSFATLAGLTAGNGTLLPAFSPNITKYALAVPFATATLTFTPVVTSMGAIVRVNGVPVASGTASAALGLTVGNNPVILGVTAVDGINVQTYTVTVTRLPQVFTFNAASEVPVTTSGFVATGNTASFALNFAPLAGVDLTVVDNTGREPIQGAFSNLAQGQVVKLAYNGGVYAFFANYCGGNGNDLVLQWANTRLASWGFNYSGQLGINTTTDSNVPVAVDASGVLAGKSVIAMSTGGDAAYSIGQSLVLCADGTLAAWGSNGYGQLGNISTTGSKVPVAVDRSGVLAGKFAVAAASGRTHHLVLCADGTLVSWGRNSSGQLGEGGTSNRSVPVGVKVTGALAGKRIAAIAAGGDFSMALCTDGTLASWGDNANGQLGIGTTVASTVPILVDRSGVLLGKQILAIAAGSAHALALCSDGSIAAWGSGLSGQLGTGAYADSTVPVLVDRGGTLAGKAVAGIAAGSAHSLALCTDGMLAAWGQNATYQLGNSTVPFNGSMSLSPLPVPVLTATGALADKTVSSAFAAAEHNLVRCSDGTLATWGNGYSGRLGNGGVSGYTPTAVPVNTTLLRTGESFTAAVTGPLASHNLAVVAMPPHAEATTLAATGLMDTSATLNGSVNANSNSTSVSFEYGLTTSYGATLTATPAAVTGTVATATSAAVNGLSPATLYHYRIIATNPYGTSVGEDMTFTTTYFAALDGLSVSSGTLAPAFAAATLSYQMMVSQTTNRLTVTAAAANASSSVKVNGGAASIGTATGVIDLAFGINTIGVTVTGVDVINTQTYTLAVTRLPEAYVFNSATDVPVTAGTVAVAGCTAALVLNHVPVAGSSLTVINNTGTGFIQGAFDNLAQGQLVDLAYNGVTYPFVVNYYGGSGNGLVLQWANNRLFAWGDNASGQLGNNSTVAGNVPVLVDMSGALAGKTILAAVAGGSRNLVWCADGTLFQWGKNTAGQMSSFNGAMSTVALPVDQSGVLAGKQVSAIAVGDDHCLVLCADGTLAAWGSNQSRQLGNATAAYNGETKPVLVDQSGVLAGKTVIAIAAGAYHNLALCADGSLAVWGGNGNGQLGDGTTNNNYRPSLVNRSGVLAGKTITAVAAGSTHSLVLCADGTLAGWGYNSNGQLGNNTTTSASAPVSVDLSGVLAGKSVTAIATGYYHSIALCADGTLATWGFNTYGQLGNGVTTTAKVPVLVNKSGVLTGQTITAIGGGQYHSAAHCATGTTADWGYNTSGQLGNGSSANSTLPTLVSSPMLAGGERLATVSCGSSHNLALSARPPPPVATTLAATAITDTGAIFNGQVNAKGSITAVTFEYGPTEAYGLTVAATPASLSDTTTTTVALNPTNLTAGATYHFRVVATNAGGDSRGPDMTFTTTSLSRLAALTPGAGTLAPVFNPSTVAYIATVPFASTSLTVTPQAEIATTMIKVNGNSVASGSASTPLPLAVGNNPVSVVTAAADGINTMTYTMMVTRLPQTFTFSSTTTVPVTADAFLATGVAAEFALTFAPAPGADFTAINNTGTNAIQGRFTNLTQGQAVGIPYAGTTYVFVADYFGGTGNDLVLHWANTRLLAWGDNSSGQLGNGTTSGALVPVPVDESGALANKMIVSATSGLSHALARCQDGTLAAWGNNGYGQLGDTQMSSYSVVPLTVDQSGVLAGKSVTGIAAGTHHSLALCADGTLATWGYGQWSGYNTYAPVAVDRTGILKDRQVVAVAAGNGNNLALCADGLLVAWGLNEYGQHGNGTNTSSTVPVALNTSGVLNGKRVTAIAAGSGSCLALCEDGTLAAWGLNGNGQLGNGSTTHSSLPVAVDQSGVLAGKTIVAIATGGHSLALCSDGTLAAWGFNSYGQLGNNSTTDSNVPVAVIRSGVLANKTVTALAATATNSYALCSDGTLAAWGTNNSGQLGNNSTIQSNLPVLVNTTNLTAKERFVKLCGGSLALVASPPQDLTPSIADGSSVVGTHQPLAWSHEPLASTFRVFFGSNRDAVSSATETSPEYLGSSPTPAWTGTQPNLMLDTVYYWRVDTVYAMGMRPGKVWSFRIAPIEMAPSINHVIIKGMAVATLDFPITTTLTTSQPWSVSAASLPSWLTPVAASGTTPQPLRLRFDPGSLATGPYQTVLRVVSGAAAFDLPVTFRIVDIDITQLVAHPTRPVVYGINRAASGEAFARVVEIDAATGTMLRSLPVGTGPTDADLDPVHERLYVPNMTNWQHTGTCVIDLAKWTELPPLMLVADANRLEATSTGRILSEGWNQWVTADLYDAATGVKLATLGSVRAGDCEIDPSGKYYYHCDANSSGARILKCDISGDTFESVAAGPILAYGSYSLLLSGDGTRLFWQGYSFAADDLHALARMPAEIHATNRSGDLAIGADQMWWSDSGSQAATLPFSSSIAAVSANDAYLVRFNATTKTLVSTPLAGLTDLPGPWPRPGQTLADSPPRLTWSPVAGATAYRVFIAADAAALLAMTTPVATVSNTYYDLPAPLAAGKLYTWRVDAVTGGGGTTKGNVQSFGIQFLTGPALPMVGTGSAGQGVAISDRNLLVGSSYSALLYDFNPTTSDVKLSRTLTELPNSATAVALDTGKSAVGAFGYDTPVTDGGAVHVYRPLEAGYWESGGPLTLATPVAGEAYGTGLSASGNLMLAGTGYASSKIGRVGAYITEPASVLTQTFSAADGSIGDGFGYAIAMEGNQAVIAAPGRGPSLIRVGCIYAFSRSTTTGLWTQTQKIPIAGATSAGVSGKALALAGNTLATISDSGAVEIYTKNAAGQWAQSASINRSAVAGSSTSFGCALALLGDQLFIGDSAATCTLGSSGAVFSFRRSGTAWVAGPALTPAVSLVSSGFGSFGCALAVRDGWLLAAGGSAQPAWLFRVEPAANQTPRFLANIPSQVVSGRAFATAIHAEDGDGNTGLVMELLQGPAWLKLADGGDGNAVLSGTPAGNPGDACDVQLRVRDSAGAQAYHACRLTVLAATDLPSLTLQPLGGDTSEGRELILQAAVEGIGPFRWQWFHDDQPISGATRSSLAFDDIALSDAGHYQARVTNVVGEVVSADAIVTVAAASRYAGDWPTFGGSPAHNGRHPAALDGYSLVPAWTQTVKSGRSLNRAAIANGRAFIVPGASWDAGNEVTALDLTTGTPVWSFPFPSSYSSNPPSVYDGRIYFQRVNNENDSFLFCLNGDTGEQLWKSPVAAQWEEYQAPAVTAQGIFVEGGTYGGMYGFNFDGSRRFNQRLEQYDGWCPTLANGHLYTCVGESFKEHSPLTGATLWSVATTWDWNGWSANTVVAVTGDSAMVFNNAAAICIDLPSRLIRWQKPGAFSGSFAIGYGMAFAIQGNAVHSFSLRDGAPGLVYQTDATGTLLSQPIVFNDRLAISNTLTTWIFDLADGHLLQTLNAGGPLSYSNSYLLAAGTDGVLRAFIALSNNPRLAGLGLSAGTMLPGFKTSVTSYIATVPYSTNSLTVTPTTEHRAAAVQVNGVAVTSGAASGTIPLAVGNNTITVLVTAEDGIDTMSYVITVTRLPESFVFNSASDVPVTANGFDAGGYPVNVRLNYAPTPGTILTMVNNTGLGFIHGAFSNLAQGQRIGLTFNGATYDFVVNYHGGSGNDLVLQWAATQVVGWGSNSYGQLGDNSTTRRLLPTPADATGVLAGRTFTAVAEGYLHSLALCSDGTLAAWGYNVYGQLGNNGSAPSNVPVAVDRSGALAGKTVIAIAAGPFHNLALCADGSVVAWGYNNYGQLGTGDTATRRVPVLVAPTGALAGKQVVTVAAGAYHSFALCADGTLVGWGFNDDGELGDGTSTGRLVPVAVNMSGALAGKQIAALSAGQYHTLAHCTDGTLLAWGYNNRGQLGNNSTTSSKVPVGIGAFGALAGRQVTTVRASGAHSLALCADGTLTAWGWNKTGQLGVTGITQSNVPLAIDMAAITAGTTLTQIGIGGSHSFALCANDTLAAWGDNASGQLGNNSTTPSTVPVRVDMSGLTTGARWMALASGSAAQHNLAVVGLPSVSFTPHASGLQGMAVLGSDQSGDSDLIVYAFGLDATMNGRLPQGQWLGGRFVVRFNQPAGVTGITYGAEWSTSLLPGSWLEAPDTGTGGEHVFNLPAGTGPQAFLRLKVTSSPPP